MQKYEICVINSYFFGVFQTSRGVYGTIFHFLNEFFGFLKIIMLMLSSCIFHVFSLD